MPNPYLDNLSCWKKQNKEWIMLVWSLSSAAWEQHSVRKYSVMARSRFICLIRPNRGLAVKYLHFRGKQRTKTSKWVIAERSEAWSPRGKTCMQKWDIIQHNAAPTGFTQVKPIHPLLHPYSRPWTPPLHTDRHTLPGHGWGVLDGPWWRVCVCVSVSGGG